MKLQSRNIEDRQLFIKQKCASNALSWEKDMNSNENSEKKAG